MYHISPGLNTTQIIRLFISGNHINSLILRDEGETYRIYRRMYKKVKKYEFMKKEQSKLINRLKKRW